MFLSKLVRWNIVIIDNLIAYLKLIIYKENIENKDAIFIFCLIFCLVSLTLILC